MAEGQSVNQPDVVQEVGQLAWDIPVLTITVIIAISGWLAVNFYALLVHFPFEGLVRLTALVLFLALNWKIASQFIRLDWAVNQSRYWSRILKSLGWSFGLAVFLLWPTSLAIQPTTSWWLIIVVGLAEALLVGSINLLGQSIIYSWVRLPAHWVIQWFGILVANIGLTWLLITTNFSAKLAGLLTSGAIDRLLALSVLTLSIGIVALLVLALAEPEASAKLVPTRKYLILLPAISLFSASFGPTSSLYLTGLQKIIRSRQVIAVAMFVLLISFVARNWLTNFVPVDSSLFGLLTGMLIALLAYRLGYSNSLSGKSWRASHLALPVTNVQVVAAGLSAGYTVGFGLVALFGWYWLNYYEIVIVLTIFTLEYYLASWAGWKATLRHRQLWLVAILAIFTSALLVYWR